MSCRVECLAAERRCGVHMYGARLLSRVGRTRIFPLLPHRTIVSSPRSQRYTHLRHPSFSIPPNHHQTLTGTDRPQKLFVGPPSSNINLVGKIEASAAEVTFRFEEDLMFRIPFRPVVHLTGKVVLKREANTGLISSYQEFWDQDVKTVLKSAKFSSFKS